MLKCSLTFFVSVMLISAADGADQNTLTDVGSTDKSLQQQLIDDPDNRIDRRLNRELPPSNNELISISDGADQNALADVGLAIKTLQEQLIDDFSNITERQLKRQPPSQGTCPAGFTYVPVAGSCYMVVYESHNWWAASTRCHQLGHGAHLVTITSAGENDALKTFLAYQMPNHPACANHGQVHTGGFFWTSGQRRDPNSCNRRRSPFVWKPWSGTNWEYQFSYWLPREPNCVRRKEHCMHIWPMKGFGWNDVSCDTRMCPLCECNPK